MIHIKKGSEPESLRRYRSQPFATYDGFDRKEDIREALLRDQGHICAYRMRSISNDRNKMKIEHWKPQSTMETEAEKLDFQILLGVCDGCAGSEHRYTTCDTHRENKPLKVNPFNEKMMETISYSREGIIKSSDPDIDRDLNDVLNLNCKQAPSRIVAGRKGVYEEVMTRLQKLQREGKWSKGTLHKVAKYYEKKNNTYPPYVGVAQYILKRYANR